MKLPSCPMCGMSKSEWIENDGKGVESLGETYCCDGCSSGGGCACDETRKKTDRIMRK